MGFFTGGSSPEQFTIGELMNIDNTRQAKAANCEVELVKVFHELQKENVLSKFKSASSITRASNSYPFSKLPTLPKKEPPPLVAI